ncbi:unnamed protein product [Rotaria sordida]|uniref:UDP-N-acetylglucosamine--dolichyl-phosphate N-acetylglucosaminephosphotransferase n=1 Tax=Rotaria sordida TaxID=392033 RepID=A0A813QQV7_9BILA|nr:unnamed protein product [Rotaria sordida]CAF0770331.1 unnamed protein product [Rotaria sordida]
MLLFFIPQIINFLPSIPQLFHFIPCPRHRLPRLNVDLNKLNASEIEFKKNDLKPLGRLMLQFFSAIKFIRYREYKMNDNEIMIVTTNFTIINTILCWTGPLYERTLTKILIFIQIVF